MPSHNTERLLTVQELADVLNVAPAAVYKMVAAGQIPALRVGGRLRFNHGEVVAHFQRGAEAAQ